MNQKNNNKIQGDDDDDDSTVTTLTVEALTLQQRRKRSLVMKRHGKRIAMKRQRALKKKAQPDALKKRALKKARMILTKKMLKGRDLSKLSISDKQRLEDRLDSKKAIIAKLAKKLLPVVKKAENERIAKMREKDSASDGSQQPANESTDESMITRRKPMTYLEFRKG